MNKTKIPWADYTWNPISGCSPASEGCAHCYAATISKRFHLPWGKPHFHPERLDEPHRVKKPSKIFACSMSDIFHPGVKTQWFDAIFTAICRSPQHQYIILTKRPDNMPSLSNLLMLHESIWLGVTVESQKHVDRYGMIADWPGVRFVSVEPMLEPVTFEKFATTSRPTWVIAGPETGPGARPCEPKWIDALAAESPCFFDKRKGAKRREFPSKVTP